MSYYAITIKFKNKTVRHENCYRYKEVTQRMLEIKENDTHSQILDAFMEYIRNLRSD